MGGCLLSGHARCCRSTFRFILRYYARDEKLPLRRGAFLETVGEKVFHQSKRGGSILVGRSPSLEAFLKAHFDHAKIESRGQGNKSRIELHWRHLHGPVLTLPGGLAGEMGLEGGNKDSIKLCFESEYGWYHFQRITGSDAQLVEGTAAYIRS